ncbi:hypothetical protein LR48_Vigan07g154000 [Vigna angularis]|uniref:Ubiquitin-like protease family profile domain-containing protein n=1 Tax=Phaseolus angularis TaxID=3914 RepID=A0A0L9UYR0_PHAAN|nr:hypothetical protein LR48_Vigan07g154000 [Vigna angularis]
MVSQGKRLAAQERQRLNDAPHLLSRGGYAKLEKKLRKSRADALGLESPDLAPTPARYELWKAAQTKSDGNMTSSSTALISQRIFTRPQKQPIHDTIIHEDDDMAEAEDDPLSKLMTRLPRLKKAQLELYWDLRVFGLPPHVPVYITLSDALEVIGGDRMYMDTIVVDQGRSSMYGFVEPQTIQSSGNTLENRQHYLQTWMDESKRDVYLVPYIDGSHWQLMVIIPKACKIIWFCSLHRKMKNDLRTMLQGSDSLPRSPYLAPSLSRKKNHGKEKKFKCFMEIFKKVEIKVPMIETLQQHPVQPPSEPSTPVDEAVAGPSGSALKAEDGSVNEEEHENPCAKRKKPMVGDASSGWRCFWWSEMLLLSPSSSLLLSFFSLSPSSSLYLSFCI